jgi:hypothetical protein
MKNNILFMKNKDLKEIRQNLEDVSYIKGKKIAYAIFKNKELIDKELEYFNKIVKSPHPDFYKFENERQLILMKYCIKDETNNPILVDLPDGRKQFQFAQENVSLVEPAIIELENKYKDVLEEVKNDEIEMTEFLEQDVKLTFEKITFNDLPDNVDAFLLDKFKFMIE